MFLEKSNLKEKRLLGVKLKECNQCFKVFSIKLNLTQQKTVHTEKNPVIVINVANPSAADPTSLFIRDYIMGENPMDATTVGKPSIIPQTACENSHWRKPLFM